MSPSRSKPKDQLDAVILGAGIIGLSIANELADAGLRVAILGRNLPEDKDSTDFCSPWAGASFAPYATSVRELAWEEATIKRFISLIDDEKKDFVRRTEAKYGWNEEGAYKTPLSAKVLPDWRTIPSNECPRTTTLGIGFTSLTLNPPSYLSYLLHRLSTHRNGSVPIHRARLSSLSQAYNHPLTGPVKLVINATGLGSFSLLGVEDKGMFPAMGQTVTVRAPLVDTYIGKKDPRPRSRSRSRPSASSADGNSNGNSNMTGSTAGEKETSATGEQIYIIPRPASGGLVTLGGCFKPGEWCAHPDPARAERILREAYALEPKLAGHVKEEEVDEENGWKGMDVISHNAGLRPCRKGGPRVELEMITGQGAKGAEGGVACVHAYGLGSSGYQWSVGVAQYVGKIVRDHLKGEGSLNKSRL